MLNTTVGKAGRHIDSLVAQVPDPWIHIHVSSTRHALTCALQTPIVQSGLIVMSSSACRSLLNSFRSLSSAVISSKQQVRVCSVAILKSLWNSSYAWSFFSGSWGSRWLPQQVCPCWPLYPPAIRQLLPAPLCSTKEPQSLRLWSPRLELAPGSAWKHAGMPRPRHACMA